ncbi:NADPH:quinone reductase-like Zn-dependent oxidoreductase [Granulicella aggregans]|uniref:NADPH:quinone reductase-like Zn-dependent oxidoreductase n=1 Tax=Granulicella aggregans TaxID=474949 RepID=A0A7W7ZHP1_9BACT|nr:NADP-dependent oxidoreductase [Granulicella aggregans]MBB5060105.1 NADPH:quinone reductase-like Zn-dependent oxidoreductase [Granulicella aggregans]
MTNPKPTMMKALYFKTIGKPLDVLCLEDVAIPIPGTGQLRVRVHACALNPADWAVCEGFLPVPPPKGIGFDVAGTVDALGEGVTSFNVGDLVFGVPDYIGQPTGGAAEYAILKVFLPIPEGLDITEAAALPMAVETAARSIDLLPLTAGQTLMVNGGGTMTGFAAVQIALLRGANVIASAGETFADRLRDLGAEVTPYGEGMVERVRELADGAPDFALHAAQVKGSLPDLVKIVDGDPKRVFSFADRDEAGIGVRTAWKEQRSGGPRYDVLGHYAQLAAEGRFSIPIARTFALEDWREAAESSMSKKAHGKLVLLPGTSNAGNV